MLDGGSWTLGNWVVETGPCRVKEVLCFCVSCRYRFLSASLSHPAIRCVPLRRQSYFWTRAVVSERRGRVALQKDTPFLTPEASLASGVCVTRSAAIMTEDEVEALVEARVLAVRAG